MFFLCSSGGRRVKKLSFGNALFNIGSQDIWNKAKPKEERKPRSLSLDLPAPKKSSNKGILKPSSETIEKSKDDSHAPKPKRRLRWADGKTVDCRLITASPALCKIKLIPLEIRQKSGPEIGTQVDKGRPFLTFNPFQPPPQPNMTIQNNMGMMMGETIKEGFVPHSNNNFNYNPVVTQFPTLGIPPIDIPPPGMPRMDTSRLCSKRDIVDKVVRWMPQWLEEQKHQKDEPEVEGKGWQINAVPSVYSSFKDYCNVVYPLMMHELWSTVFRDYVDQQLPIPSLGMKRPTFIAFITEISQPSYNNPRQHVLSLTSLISHEENRMERDGCLPNRGWLVILDLIFSKTDTATGCKKEERKRKFGFVESFRSYRRSRDHGNVYINHLEEARTRANVPKNNLQYVMDLSLSIKYLDPKLEGMLETSKIVIIQSVSRIETSLRLFQAVEDAHHSPLFSNILRPKEKNFYLGNDTEIKSALKHHTLPQYANLNTEQKRIVASAARMVTTNPGLPQMALIHGPPGTGKSTTIVGLILQIFARCEQETVLPRILLTAPSNTAVDELLRKLKAVRRKISSSHSHHEKGKYLPKFRMVRIGEEKKIHPDIKDYRLESLRDHEVNKRLKDKGIGDTLQEEIQRRQKAINSLGVQLVNCSSDPDSEHQSRILHRRIKEEEIALEQAKRNQGNNQSQREKDKLRREVTDSILASADIVATTLSR